MSITATGGAEAEAPADTSHGHAHGPLGKLMVGAIGIVYGDIGTSPISPGTTRSVPTDCTSSVC
jgi:KUP system potassium uptake protein